MNIELPKTERRRRVEVEAEEHREAGYHERMKLSGPYLVRYFVSKPTHLVGDVELLELKDGGERRYARWDGKAWDLTGKRGGARWVDKYVDVVEVIE